MPFVRFSGREEERGNEKEINKKVNCIWLMEKNKRIDAECVVKLYIKIDKVVF